MHTAARMEALCGEFGVDAVLSADVAAHLDGAVTRQPLGEATVKGKAQAITAFTLA